MGNQPKNLKFQYRHERSKYEDEHPFVQISIDKLLFFHNLFLQPIERAPCFQYIDRLEHTIVSLPTYNKIEINKKLKQRRKIHLSK